MKTAMTNIMTMTTRHIAATLSATLHHVATHPLARGTKVLAAWLVVLNLCACSVLNPAASPSPKFHAHDSTTTPTA